MAFHLDPITLPHRVVGRNLDAGHESHDRVLEHKEKTHEHRTQPGHQRPHLAAHDNGDHKYATDKTGDQHHRLGQALDRDAPRYVKPLVNLEHTREHRLQRE